MKILKRGKLPANDTYRATCGRCKTEIEFSRGEARLTADQRDGDYLTVNCPVCGRVITVAA